ncbi:hypothetical protein Hhel01_04233 [Haloferula helveola]
MKSGDFDGTPRDHYFQGMKKRPGNSPAVCVDGSW